MNEAELIAEIVGQNRTFLPGAQPTTAMVEASIKGNILLHGLTKVEAMLVLSTLPVGPNRIFFSPMDKGLSKAKVYSGRYQLPDNGLSRAFVFKIGPRSSIQREYEAVQNFVSPHIAGVEVPILRTGQDRGLIVQAFVGLDAKVEPISLKAGARTVAGPEYAYRLLDRRLGKWYRDGLTNIRSHNLGALFKRYLDKAKGFEYPRQWSELKTWVERISSKHWIDPEPVIISLKDTNIITPATIVHGDLHSQNVLVDDTKKETWPIDFAWCRSDASPILDFAMLECSLKFLAFPQRSDLHTLIHIDYNLLSHRLPAAKVDQVPYHDEILNVFRTIKRVRRYAFEDMKISWRDYRKALTLMTYAHSTHPELNQPLVLASLQMALAIESGTASK